MSLKKNEATSAGGSNTCLPDLKKAPRIEFDADSGEFDTIESVPLFDAHDGKEEGLDIKFDADLLGQIVDQCNARIRDTGDLVPVTDRHTSDDPGAPEPEILGYAGNFKLGEIGEENPRPCIYADLKIYKNKMALAKQLPRRSIELWPDLVIDPVVLKKAEQPAIDSVALLGAQRPARDLGLLFKKNGSRPTRYQHEFDSRSFMNPEQLIQQCVEALTNTPEFAFIRDLMSKQHQAEMEGEPEAYAEAETPKPDEEEMAEEGVEEGKDEKLEPAKLRMQRDQERRKNARLDSQYKALFAKVAALERDKRVADRKADLLALEGEGFDFDLAEELEYVADMEPARYSKHLAKIKTRYRKAPIGVSITPARVPAEGGKEPAVAHQADVYAKVASLYKTGKSFDKKPQE
jgi:hypothetical protein